MIYLFFGFFPYLKKKKYIYVLMILKNLETLNDSKWFLPVRWSLFSRILRKIWICKFSKRITCCIIQNMFRTYIFRVFYVCFPDDNKHNHVTWENQRHRQNNCDISRFWQLLNLHLNLVEVDRIRFNQKTSPEGCQVIAAAVNKSVRCS